jgi:hypothetical protein
MVVLQLLPAYHLPLGLDKVYPYRKNHLRNVSLLKVEFYNICRF